MSKGLWNISTSSLQLWECDTNPCLVVFPLARYRDDQIKIGEFNCNSVLKHPVQSLGVLSLDEVINYYLEFISFF